MNMVMVLKVFGFPRFEVLMCWFDSSKQDERDVTCPGRLPDAQPCSAAERTLRWQLARREHVRVLIKNSMVVLVVITTYISYWWGGLLKTWKPFWRAKHIKHAPSLLGWFGVGHFWSIAAKASWSTFCSRERQRLCLAERVLHWTSMAWNRLWKWRERRVERTRDFGSAEWSCKIKASGKDLSWSMLSLSLLNSIDL